MHTQEIIRTLRAPDQQGMGRLIDTVEYGSENLDRLTRLDAVAHTVRVWDGSTIPGVLQTPGYSARVIAAAHPRLDGHEIRRRVVIKDRRAKEFLRRILNPGELHMAYFAIGEEAILRCVNAAEDGGETHAAQLRHLVELSKHPRIAIRMLPEFTMVPGGAHQFALYGLDDALRIGYVETIMGSWYSTRPEDIARLHSTFSDIMAETMSPVETRHFVGEVLDSWQSAKRTSRALTEESTSSSPPTRRRATTASESPEQHDRPET
ncbi:DUF5753 domain-containing protein [Streptomyces tsukubensis]|uniref:DUF5753 domain-containing protein n=1 Tax=Streptomyces tsukubensis TaxID=83656 RepID=UPI00344CFBCF